MGLIACPDCQQQISDAAPTCPGCGRPQSAAVAAAPPARMERRRRAGAPWEAGGALVMLVSMGACAANADAGAVVFLIGLGVFVVGRIKD